MKKLYLIFVIFYTFKIGYSQEEKSFKQFRLGITISPLFNWLKPENKDWNYDGARLGINYGVIADISLVKSENYFFGTGITLSSLGGKLDFPSVYDTGLITEKLVSSSAASTYKLNYLNIPLTLKLRTNEIGYLHYFLSFGAIIGFNIKSKRDIRYSVPSSNLSRTIEDENINDEINLIRASLAFGGGVEYKINGKTYFVAGLKYENGLSNIFKGYAYKLDNNGNVIIQNNKPINDRLKKVLQHTVHINISILF